MNGHHRVIDFPSKAVPAQPVDAELEDFNSLYAATQPTRVCPPCDGQCNEGRICPARKKPAAKKSDITVFLGFVGLAFVLWIAFLTVLLIRAIR